MSNQSHDALDRLEKIARQVSEKGVTDERKFVDLVTEAAGTLLTNPDLKPEIRRQIRRVAWTLIDRQGKGSEAAIEDIQYIRKQLPKKSPMGH